MTRREALAVLAAGALSALGGCHAGPPEGVVAGAGHFTTSNWPGRTVRWRLMAPAASPTPRLVVALHGRGGSADDAFDGVGLGDHVARTGLAVASVDGGDLYWHARRDGSDTGAMVIEDLLPMLRADHGLSAAPIGLTGLSMGGYGALLLASTYGPRVVGAVVAESAALWTSPGASAPGAFDDAEDFRAHDVFRRGPALSHIPIRLDCGTSDPFYAANRAFTKVVPHARATFDTGGHDDTYWRSHAGTQMDWLAGILTGS